MFRTHFSPALVVAVIALVVASAGTATAATKILIKSSAQVKNGALDASDLSAKARKSLQGKAGPAGATGPAGPTGATGATGPAGARGPSELFAARSSGINTFNCPAGGCDSGAVLKTIDLPAGNYLLSGSAEIAPSTFVASAEHNIECHLARTDTDEFQRTLQVYEAPPNTGIVADQTVEVTWALKLAAPTKVSMSCFVGSTKFGAANVRLTALQVGTLTETVS